MEKKVFEESEKLFLNLPVTNNREQDFDFFQDQFKTSKSQTKLLMQSIDEFANALEGELRLTLKSIPKQIYDEIEAKFTHSDQ